MPHNHAAEIAAIIADPAFKMALAALDAEHERTVADIVALTEIPAPPFKEERRAAAYLDMLAAHGLAEVERDEIGNVMGLRRGEGNGGLIAVAALSFRRAPRLRCGAKARSCSRPELVTTRAA